MAPPRRMLAALVAALALAVPAPALAQSAGDDQYQDPFGSDTGGGDGSGSSGGGTTTPAPTTPAPAAPAAPSASASQAPAAPAAPQLPYTGAAADAGLLAGAGVLLLAGGIGLRVRLREPA